MFMKNAKGKKNNKKKHASNLKRGMKTEKGHKKKKNKQLIGRLIFCTAESDSQTGELFKTAP